MAIWGHLMRGQRVVQTWGAFEEGPGYGYQEEVKYVQWFLWNKTGWYTIYLTEICNKRLKDRQLPGSLQYIGQIYD